MIWLLLSISCSVLIFVVFRLFKRYHVDNLQAIVVNYLVAYSLGNSLSGWPMLPWELAQQSWWPNVLLMGLLFITLFRLMAYVSQRFGVAAVSVAVKMSVVLPIVFGLWYYGESIGPLKIGGIVLALLAVFLSTYREPHGAQSEKNWQSWLWPLLLFIGSGFIDLFLKYNEAEVLRAAEQSIFASSIFGVAAVLGIVMVALRRKIARAPFQWKALWGGLALGIPNYGSIYFLLRALSLPQFESSTLFALNNLGIVALSTLVGAIAFREKLNRYNLLGIALALVSIALISLVL